MGIEMTVLANDYEPVGISLEEKGGKGVKGSDFEVAREAITRKLELPKDECNVNPDVGYPTIKYFFQFQNVGSSECETRRDSNSSDFFTGPMTGCP